MLLLHRGRGGACTVYQYRKLPLLVPGTVVCLRAGINGMLGAIYGSRCHGLRCTIYHLWLLGSRMNPARQLLVRSMDFAYHRYDTNNFTIVIPRWRRHMDRLVTFTNLYNPRNRITGRRHRNSVEHGVTACSSCNVTIIRHVRFAPD